MKSVLRYICVYILVIFPLVCSGSATIAINPDDDGNRFTLIRDDVTEESFSIRDGNLIYSGPVSGLIKYLLNISSYQIMFRYMTDYGIIMECAVGEINRAKTNPLPFMEKRLSLEAESESMDIEAITFNITDTGLLTNHTSENKQDIIFPHKTISAQKETTPATLTGIANLLTDLKHCLYYYEGEDTTLYNWNFNWKNNRQMEQELRNNYGITLKNKDLKLPVFVISPLLSY